MRKVIIVLVGVAIVAVAIMASNAMGSSSEKSKKPKAKVALTTVFAEQVKLSAVPVMIETTGNLQAIDKLELYSEVQGVMKPDGGRFKAGTRFSRGQVLVGIKSPEIQAQLVAQRSSFEKLITSIMPDLKLDYPNDFQVWSAYLSSLDVKKSLSELPAASSEQLKLFLTGRSIYSEYYTIKNGEINLSKYSIKAPFSGVLIEANADPGTVIRPGQKLGVFIKTGNYELEASVDATTADKLRKGQKVMLSKDKYFDTTYEGTISRINKTINSQSQMNSFYVQVKSEQLADGMFMHAKIQASEVEKGFEVSRSMIFNGNSVFVVKDNLLVERKIVVEHINENKAIISGIKDQEQILSKIPPGAYSGMKVNIYQNPE